MHSQTLWINTQTYEYIILLDRTKIAFESHKNNYHNSDRMISLNIFGILFASGKFIVFVAERKRARDSTPKIQTIIDNPRNALLE